MKSDFRYHIIKLDDVRALKTPASREVKPQIQQRLQQQKVEKHLLDLRSQVSIKGAKMKRRGSMGPWNQNCSSESKRSVSTVLIA